MHLEPGGTSTLELMLEILNTFKLLIIFFKKAPLQMFEWVENILLAKG